MLQSQDTYFALCYGQSAAAAAEQAAPAAGLEFLRQPRVPPAWSQQIPQRVGNSSPDQQTALGEHCSLYTAYALQVLQPALRLLQPFAQHLGLVCKSLRSQESMQEMPLRASLQEHAAYPANFEASHMRTRWTRRRRDCSGAKPADMYFTHAVTPPESGYIMLDPELPAPRFSAMNAQKRERRPALPLVDALSYVKAWPRLLSFASHATAPRLVVRPYDTAEISAISYTQAATTCMPAVLPHLRSASHCIALYQLLTETARRCERVCPVAMNNSCRAAYSDSPCACRSKHGPNLTSRWRWL